MEFADFEDDLFESNEKPANRISDVVTYAPKIEPPGFFLTNENSEDDLERSRMKANYYFSVKNYQLAAELYKKCFSLTNSNGAKFEFYESLARCYIKSNNFNDAEIASLKVYEMATNFDQQVQALYALGDLYQTFEKFADNTVVCSILLSFFDTNAQFWFDFSSSFKAFNDFDSTLRSKFSVEIYQFCDMCRYEISGACLVRCLELLRIMQNDSVRPRLVDFEKLCVENLGHISLSDETKFYLKSAICQDLVKSPEAASEKQQSCEIIAGNFNDIWKKFLIKWFSFVFHKCTSCCGIVKI